MISKRQYSLITFGWIIVCLTYYTYKIYSAYKNDSGFSESISSEYIQLFSDDTRKKIKEPYTYLSKVRNPITTFNYNVNYDIVVCKIGGSNNISLMEVIENNKTSDLDENTVYSGVTQFNFNLYFQSESHTSVKGIFLTYSGDSFKTIIKNDSTAYYHFNFNNFSVKFTEQEPADIYAEKNSIDKNKPVSLLFIKRDGALFFLMITRYSSKKEIDENLLYSLIKNK